jgi:hypothetical protein
MSAAAAADSPRIRKKLLGPVEPQSKPKEIRDLTNPEYYNKINLRPSYQRQLRWLLVAFCEFIGIIMNTGLVQPIYMYQLFPEDKVEGDKYYYEVVDGQHRLWVINAFRTCAVNKLSHISKPFIVHWIYVKTDENGTKCIQRVFYKLTTEVTDWFKKTYPKETPYSLTPDEREHFDNFTINIIMLRSQLSLDDRREVFISLQKGVPVRNSDYIKNLTDVKLIKLFETNGYEKRMVTLLEYCSRKITNYWTQWAAKFWLIFRNHKKEPYVEIFLILDTTITKEIKYNQAKLNPTVEEFELFDNNFQSYLEFLQSLPAGIQFNSIQIFALYAHLCEYSDCNREILATHMPRFSSEGQKKEYKSLWLSGNRSEMCRTYFNDCLSQLRYMSTKPRLAIIIDTRKISKTLRTKVYKKAVVPDACDTCNKSIDMEHFEAGHILARVKGGTIDIDNLIPLCSQCNKGMGTQNPYEYKKNLPYNRL